MIDHLLTNSCTRGALDQSAASALSASRSLGDQAQRAQSASRLARAPRPNRQKSPSKWRAPRGKPLRATPCAPSPAHHSIEGSRQSKETTLRQPTIKKSASNPGSKFGRQSGSDLYRRRHSSTLQFACASSFATQQGRSNLPVCDGLPRHNRTIGFAYFRKRKTSL